MNKKTLSISLAAAAIACAVALPKIVRADDLSIHAGGVGININDGHHDHEHHHVRHEEMDAALGALRDARAHLDRGGHDFDGHRMKAIKHADKAIEEIRIAIDWADHHDR